MALNLPGVPAQVLVYKLCMQYRRFAGLTEIEETYGMYPIMKIPF